MEPLIALVAVTAVVRLLGATVLPRLDSWYAAVRGGLAAMFVLTGSAHFVGMREEILEMVPSGLPAPELLVTVTGALELAGAVGLLHRRTAPWAGAGLTLLLVAMFPANVHVALEGIGTGFSDRLVPRTLMQVVFVGAAGFVGRRATGRLRR